MPSSTNISITTKFFNVSVFVLIRDLVLLLNHAIKSLSLAITVKLLEGCLHKKRNGIKHETGGFLSHLYM